MSEQNPDQLVGYAWLLAHTRAKTVRQGRTISMIGGSRRSLPGVEIYPEQYRPDTGERALQEQVRFALAHESLDLEALARIFLRLDKGFIVAWLRQEPTSAYARRVGFLYEWLTGRRIEEHDRASSGNYVDAIDPQRYLTATSSAQNRRWRVNDNLPGTRDFCPTIELSQTVRQTTQVPFNAHIESLTAEFGQEMIMRSASWLSVKESRASFQIEREVAQEDRIRRFARVMAQHCGRQEDPLDESALLTLQDAILGDSPTTFQRGLRRSPVFVGHTERYEPMVDYIAPHHDQVPKMLEGLRVFARRTSFKPQEQGSWMLSVLRATVLSFGFVYIHPLSDGNGRISRFLINDTLRRDLAVPHPLILPISAIISSNARRRVEYDRTLELVSACLMESMAGRYRLDRETRTRFDDGVISNLVVDNWEDPAPAWQYLNLTDHATYLGGIITESITEGIVDEARYLQRFDRAREALDRLVETRDEDAIRIIRAITDHQSVSHRLRRDYPGVFVDEATEQSITQAVLKAFAEAAPEAEPPHGQSDRG